MATPKREGSAFLASGITAIVLILAGTVFVGQFPLDIRRPDVTEKVSTGIQGVEARLWQDPFAAVERYRQEQGVVSRRPNDIPSVSEFEALRHGPQVLAKELLKRLQHDESVVVLGVMVPGGPNIENAERRRRTRYAVLSGLSEEHFVPDNPEYIGYVQLPSADSPSETQLLPGGVVPFEPLHDRRSPQQSIFVLWLDENALQDQPLKNLRRVLSHILPPGDQSLQCEPATDGTARSLLRILGPASSTSLHAMLRELGPPDSPNTSSPASLCNTIFVSALATASASQLLSLREDDTAMLTRDVVDGAEKNLRDRFKTWNNTFLRTAVTDTQMMHAIVEELGLRGVKLPPPGADHVALISEWDTFYGRALQEAFFGEVCRQGGSCEGVAPRIHRFSFMRGLDGVIPHASPGPAEVSAKPEADGKGRPAPTPERAEGSSQVDYLRRLAAHLRQTDRDLWWRDHKKIGAIGILVSDVYDKLLVLRAVRDEFPDVPVFTTDLDARLLDPRQRQSARNLIVASGYGLELHPSLQNAISPFRDAYQTSTFLTARLIVSLPTVTVEEWRSALERWHHPRIFEIGRSAAHDLEARPPPDCQRLVDCTDIHPPTIGFLSQVPLSLLYTFAGAVVFAVTLLYASNSWCRRASAILIQVCVGRCKPGNRGMYVVAVCIAGGVIGLGWLFIAAAHDPHGEPLALFEGISVWPSQVLRLCAIIVAVASLFHIGQVLHNVREELTERFFPQARIDQVRMRDILSLHQVRHVFTSELVAPSDQPVSTQSLWEEYLFQSAPVCRWMRVLLIWLLFIVFTMLLNSVLPPPNTPYRGEAMSRLNFWLLVPTLFLFLLLLFAVVDVIRLCDKFTRAFSRPSAASWSEEALRSESEKLGIGKDHLHGWLDIQFIADWTDRIGWMVYRPALVLFLLILARASVFDNWGTPPILIFDFAITGAYAVWCTFLLRGAAERTRRIALDHLTVDIIRATQQGGTGVQYVEQLQLLKNEIESIQEGAFARFTQQPIVGAVLIPLSSAGLTVIQHFFIY